MRVPTSVWLFLVLTVLTCIIAYWADNLGKNLGKKRISLLGLRPRQTATLISMASSVAIMLVTLLLLTFLSADFKNALFRADRLNANNQKLRVDNASLESQRQRSREEVQQLKSAAQKSKNDAQQAADDEAKAQRETGEARAVTTKARRQLASTRTQLAAAKSAVGAAKNALQTAKTSLTSAQQKASAAATRERAAQTRSRIADVAARAAEIKARAAASNAKLAQSQKDSAVAQADDARQKAGNARREADSAKRETNNARSELKTAQDDVKAAQNEVQTAQGNLSIVQESTKGIVAANRKAVEDQVKLEKQNRELLANNEDLKTSSEQIINAFATGDISISVGQVFAERIIAPGQTASAIQDQLNALQNDALQELEKPPIDATKARLLSLPAIIDNRRVSFDAEKLQSILIENLLGSEVPVAVRWVAARNHATGEKEIEGRLVPIEVRTVAPAGTVLAQETLAAGQSDAAVFSRLLALTDEARGAARARGVIPPLSPQQPNFFAVGTNERVFTALREIQSRGGAVRVSLVADAPLSSVAPPAVRFVIETPGNAAASTRAPAAASPPPSS